MPTHIHTKAQYRLTRQCYGFGGRRKLEETHMDMGAVRQQHYLLQLDAVLQSSAFTAAGPLSVFFLAW
ncbi:hypothetical protein AMELA_G00100890 [Ameiurus melas]|uniref:Uncharacterized protein n=1 Tax=Ameiurus melas TaxID=219545 RepID=A0A7J6AUY5_AMEME|nr:hypothetical protein AMELA_G00100890 [Ameiurus melas]